MSDTQTIVVQVTPAPPNPETLADLSDLAMLFFVACAAIFCLRRLLGLFSTDSHRD
ncbi:hypothetical protein [Comamonas terrae]|uniref:Uncharacterized protein n=1 Tax=Comamonas terrae TaxID=673548 RepID=A0ABW5UNJ3_9BURK|nr:hypothetical protein [Comamonas terrae]